MDDEKNAPFDADDEDDTPLGDTDEHADENVGGADGEGTEVGGG